MKERLLALGLLEVYVAGPFARGRQSGAVLHGAKMIKVVIHQNVQGPSLDIWARKHPLKYTSIYQC